MAVKPYVRTKRIRQTTDELAEAVEEARYQRKKIEANRRVSDEVKRERLQVVQEELDGTIAKIKRAGDHALKRAKIDTAPKGLPAHSGKALLVESQKARAWTEKVRPLLDAGRGPTEVAQRLASRGDRLALQTLGENLPDYLELEAQSEGEGSGARDQRADNYLTAIRELDSELRTPEEKVSHEALAEVDRAHKIMQTNLSIVRQDLEGVEPAAQLYYDDTEEPLVLEDF